MTKENKNQTAEKPKEKKTTLKSVAKEVQEKKLMAVIKTGGKQYLVEPGKTYNFEKLEIELGGEVIFEEVYLFINNNDVEVGTPNLPLKVYGEVMEQFKDKKVDVFKYKKRKRYRKSYGHRQPLTKVLITKIA